MNAVPPLLSKKRVAFSYLKGLSDGGGGNSSNAPVERIIPLQNSPTFCTLLRHTSGLEQMTKLLPYLSKFLT
jgi:hypothetical protein